MDTLCDAETGQCHCKCNVVGLKCDICAGKFTSKKMMNRHIATVHEGKESLICHICHANFKSKNGRK